MMVNGPFLVLQSSSSADGPSASGPDASPRPVVEPLAGAPLDLEAPALVVPEPGTGQAIPASTPVCATPVATSAGGDLAELASLEEVVPVVPLRSPVPAVGQLKVYSRCQNRRAHAISSPMALSPLVHPLPQHR